MNRIKKSFCLISFLLYIFFINCSIVRCEEALSEDIIFSQKVSQQILEKEKKKLLKLEKLYNARDLGGIKTPDGFFTKYKVFVRSDNTDELSEQDITYLKNYGIKTVIDLRSENEIKNFPDKLRNVTGIDWYNVDIKKGNKMSRKLISDNDYIELVKYTGDGNSQKKLFDLIANLKEGTVLFHCAAGKDRTGILAMLLLKLVGASDEDIVDNYSVSFDLIKNRPSIRNDNGKFYKKIWKANSQKKYYSSGENIMSVIKYIEDRYGNFENYFLACGISINTLNKIKEKFVG